MNWCVESNHIKIKWYLSIQNYIFCRVVICNKWWATIKVPLPSPFGYNSHRSSSYSSANTELQAFLQRYNYAVQTQMKRNSLEGKWKSLKWSRVCHHRLKSKLIHRRIEREEETGSRCWVGAHWIVYKLNCLLTNYITTDINQKNERGSKVCRNNHHQVDFKKDRKISLHFKLARVINYLPINITKCRKMFFFFSCLMKFDFWFPVYVIQFAD